MVKCLIVAGFAGVGKTYLGSILAKELGYFYIDKDTVSTLFTEKMLKDKGYLEGDRESEYYREINKIEYQTIVDIAEENIRLGNKVIISAPFINQLYEYSWLDRKFNYLREDELRLVWIKMSEEDERLSLIRRGLERDAWKLENWEEYNKKVRGFVPEGKNIYVYDRTEHPDIRLEVSKIKEWLQESGI